MDDLRKILLVVKRIWILDFFQDFVNLLQIVHDFSYIMGVLIDDGLFELDCLFVVLGLLSHLFGDGLLLFHILANGSLNF